ncbi:MAG: hypothetical protein ACRERC_16480 [Candidatus Binatia bacterium]
MRRMRAATVLGVVLATLAGAAPAEEPNVNCEKMAEWSDMMVCGNPDLTAKNAKVDEAYREAQQGLGPQDAAEVGQVQAAWKKGRAKCQQSADPTKCLHDYYDARIKPIVQPAKDADDDE